MLHIWMGILAELFFASDFPSRVQTGGPWQAILVNATAFVIFSYFLPSITLPLTLNIDSAGASENAQGEAKKSVTATLFFMHSHTVLK